jgi:Tol biopolymer transport system component
LGNVMAFGGMATIMLALAILVRVIATAPAQTGSAPPVPIIPNTPFVIPPDLPALVNPWLLAAPWIGGAVAAIGLLFALGKRSRVWPGLGVLLSALLVCTYVPPATMFPNPVGIAWHVLGGYSYDPNLPFRNMFVVSGDPTAKLRPYLDRLIGQVGLDPLDPVQPLARYAFERVTLPHDHTVVLVTTRFVYANGSSRVYDVPLFDPLSGAGFYLSAWQNDGLARLRTEHLALPGQPFATEASPVRLGDAVRLRLSPQADCLDAINPAHWAWISNRLQHLVWSPQGDSFLMIEMRPDHTRQLWLVPLDGSAPQQVGRSGSVYEYGWSPDGTFIVYTAPGEGAVASGVSEATQLIVMSRADLQRSVARRAIINTSLPSLTSQGIWYAQDGALWLMDYQTGDSARVTALPDLGRKTDAPPIAWPLAVSPDASRVAYACNNDLCQMNLDGSDRRVIRATGIRAITWDATGARLAAVSLDGNNFGPVSVLIVSRDGTLERSADIAPRDATDPPQWTPDGKIVFVQTYPMGGRRILTVNADTGQALDLSREHWDAYFALSPDGKSVLLNNGRGGLWIAQVIR